MKWIDGHCDVLYKLWKYPEEILTFTGKGTIWMSHTLKPDRREY